MSEKYNQTKTLKKLIPYQVENDGDGTCYHKLSDSVHEIAVESGIVFATFTCDYCGRVITQCVGEILPPREWEL